MIKKSKNADLVDVPTLKSQTFMLTKTIDVKCKKIDEEKKKDSWSKREMRRQELKGSGCKY